MPRRSAPAAFWMPTEEGTRGFTSLKYQRPSLSSWRSSMFATPCQPMDKRLAGLGRKFGFKYTRYADDLAFSWKKGVGGSNAKPPIGALLHGVNLVLKSEGFTINEEKTKVLRTANRQRITGLVVNAPPKGSKAPPVRVPRETVRNLEAAIFNREKGKPGKGESLASLRGMASFVSMVDPAKGKPLLARVAALEERERSKQARG